MRSTKTMGLVSVSMALAVTLTACSSDSDKEASPKPTSPFRTQPYTAPDANTGIGPTDQALPTQIPEPIHVSELKPIGADQVVIAEAGWGSLTTNLNVFDPKTGKLIQTVTSANTNWDLTPTVFAGEHPGLPYILGHEVWRPRGWRGKADYTLTWYEGDATKPAEVVLPEETRTHGRHSSNAVTPDGKYWVTWDDMLFGIRVVDLQAKKQTGKLQILNCGPFTWPVGHDIYSLCESSQELLQIHIDDNGVPSVANRTKVLPEGFTSARHAPFAADVKKALLVNGYGNAYLFDFANGLPTAPVEKAGSVVKAGISFDNPAVNADASRISVPYTDGEIPAGSARAGDWKKTIVFDAAFKEVGELTADDLGGGSAESQVFSTDGKILYVLASKDDKTTLYGFDAASLKQVSKAPVKGPGPLGEMFAPLTVTP
ncbi:hypothetical protein [Actinocorallia sp. A-T 12471]|uniref:hypothetical protein n=1 Tax=Actinocorallia sp. A-T 12471 TaxID=3089813 RepID=UPI0029D08B2F|nr:hypothetical protein [Actinocorallia sp. A-T 12471]MDX6739547.1 hypothetical protein [Actinocorallia sp. A-T 12471]